MVQTSVFGREVDTSKIVSILPPDIREIKSWQRGSEFLLYKGRPILDESFDFYKLLLIVSLINRKWLTELVLKKLNIINPTIKIIESKFFIKTPENSNLEKEDIDDKRVHVSDLGKDIYYMLSFDSDFINELNNFVENPVYSKNWCSTILIKPENEIEPTTSMADLVHRVLIS